MPGEERALTSGVLEKEESRGDYRKAKNEPEFRFYPRPRRFPGPMPVKTRRAIRLGRRYSP
jgi:hypothetical protein